MLSNDYFYFGITRKIVSIFGSVFDNILINRTDSAGNITQIINVPINYAQKEKMMVRMKQDPGIDRPTSISLPRMSFFLDGYHYDAERRRSVVNQIFYPVPGDNTKLVRQFDENPFNFYFSLFVYVKNTEDAAKIIEQIIPFFTPEFGVRAYLIPDHDSFDIPIGLLEVSHEDTDSTNFADNSTLIWTLRFVVKAAMFSPRATLPRILDSNTSLYLGTWTEANTININSFGISNVYTSRVVTNSYLIDWTDVRAYESNGIFSTDPNTFIYSQG